MAKVAFGRVTKDSSGRRCFYIPSRVAEDKSWPFKPYDTVSMRAENGRVVEEINPAGPDQTAVIPYDEGWTLTERMEKLLQRGSTALVRAIQKYRNRI
jgi:hypothetical protein